MLEINQDTSVFCPFWKLTT